MRFPISALDADLFYTIAMQLHGSIETNLVLALQSARRLRDHPVHADTLAHWADLIRHARREIVADSTEPVLTLIVELERELADRRSP